MKKRILRTLLAAATVASTGSGCGPPLTEPASSNVSGTWFAAGNSAGLSDVTVTLTQGTDGSISGNYSLTFNPGGPPSCPTSSPCAFSSTVTGANTAFQVFFELKDAGKFTGQLVTPTELKGAMNRGTRTQPVTFVKG